MLYNLSNNDGNRIVQTNELIGKKFGLIERLMLNGVKSSRLTVSESSHGIQKIIQSGQHIVFSDIEMRKKGVLIRIISQIEKCYWAIPFYKLTLYKSDNFSIHADGEFVKYNINEITKKNASLVNKIIGHRASFFDHSYNFYWYLETLILYNSGRLYSNELRGVKQSPSEDVYGSLCILVQVMTVEQHHLDQ